MPRRATPTSYGAVKGNKPGREMGHAPSFPPEAFREFMRGLTTWTLKGRYVESVLSNPDHPHFMKALEYATSHAYGRPKESVEVSGELTHKHQVWKLGDREVSF